MEHPGAFRVISTLISLVAFFIIINIAFFDKSFVAFLIAIPIGYFIYRRLYLNKKNARKRMEEQVGERLLLLKEAYTSSDGGFVYLGISDHYLITDEKGEHIVWNLKDIEDYDTGQKSSGVFRTQVSEIGNHRTATTTESKIPFVLILFKIGGAEVFKSFFSDQWTINSIYDQLNRAFTSGAIAQENEERRRAELNQQDVERKFGAFLHEAVTFATPNFIDSLAIDKNSLMANREEAIADFKRVYPHLNALDAEEIGSLHMLFEDAFSFGLAIRTLAGQHGVSSHVSITNVDTKPVVYKVIGQNRALIGSLPYVTDQQAYEFVRFGINCGFVQESQPAIVD